MLARNLKFCEEDSWRDGQACITMQNFILISWTQQVSLFANLVTLYKDHCNWHKMIEINFVNNNGRYDPSGTQPEKWDSHWVKKNVCQVQNSWTATAQPTSGLQTVCVVLAVLSTACLICPLAYVPAAIVLWMNTKINLCHSYCMTLANWIEVALTRHYLGAPWVYCHFSWSTPSLILSDMILDSSVLK